MTVLCGVAPLCFFGWMRLTVLGGLLRWFECSGLLSDLMLGFIYMMLPRN